MLSVQGSEGNEARRVCRSQPCDRQRIHQMARATRSLHGQDTRSHLTITT